MLLVGIELSSIFVDRVFVDEVFVAFAGVSVGTVTPVFDKV